MDLNINVYKNKNFDSLEIINEKIKRAIQLGFTTIALTVHIDSTQVLNIPKPITIKLETEAPNISILTRLTVGVDDVMQTHKINQSENAKKYDLLAIEPLNDNILSYLNNGHYECDIITFNFSEKIIFNIRRANFSLPISKGIGIELNYADCLYNQNYRRSIFAFGQILVDKTKSKNILISSGAQTSFSLRSPKDVTYLGLLFGMSDNQCRDAVFRNAIKVMKHSEIRKNVNIGTISLQLDVSKHENWLINEFNKRTIEEEDNNTAKRIKIKTN